MSKFIPHFHQPLSLQLPIQIGREPGIIHGFATTPPKLAGSFALADRYLRDLKRQFGH